jgi:RNA polymerase sigma-70 factor (ECF subfamily)
MTSTAEFDEIYDKYKSDVYRLAYYLTRDRGEAEDMFQEVWLRVVKHLAEKVDKDNLKPWIFVIVMNLHRDLLRKKRVRRMFFLAKTKPEMAEMSSTTQPGASLCDPVESEERAVMRRNIDHALALLPEKQRQVFVLKQMEGLQQTEIAGTLGIPVGTVKSLMHRAVKRLQRELAAHNPKREKIKCDAKILSV